MQWLNKKVAILVLLVSVLTPNTRTEATAPTVPKEASQEVIFVSAPDKLDIWIEKLVQAESNGREDIVVLDVNNRYSYGCLQYQMDTFKRFYPLMGLESPVSEDGWKAAIMSCKTQKALTRAVLGKDSGAWRHWFTSSKKIGLPPV